MTQPSDLRPGDPALDVDVDPGLAAGLDATARLYDVPAGDLTAVLGRGWQRAHRRRRALAGLCAVSLVAGIVTSVELLDGEREISVASTSGLVRGPVGVEWHAVRPETGLGYAAGLGASAPLYALSTAPGQREMKAGMPRVVWRSDDGVEWTAASTLSPDLFLSDLAADGDRIYAVGTAPAEAAVGGRRPVAPLVVGWSDDGARTWEQARLPIDLAAITARTVRSYAAGTGVVTSPLGTLVVGLLDATLDVPASLPAGVTAPNGWAFTPDGVDLLGPDQGEQCPEGSSTPKVDRAPADLTEFGEVMPLICMSEDGQSRVMVTPQESRGVTASYTWAQLGVDGDLLRAVRRQPVAFFAPAGSQDFERVELPVMAPVQGELLVDGTDAGFTLALTTGEQRWRIEPSSEVTLLRSADGRTWTADALPGGAGTWAMAAGRVAGTPIVLGQRSTGPVVVRGDGDGGWTTTPLAEAVDATARGGRTVSLMSAAVGPFGVVAAVVVAADKEGPVDYRVLASRDGLTWTDAPVTSLVDQPVRNVIRVGVVGDRATVALSVGAPGEKSQQVVLVGTPT